MKKVLLVAIVISTFLFSVLAGTMLVNFAAANPMIGTKPIYAKVSIDFPQNDSEGNAEKYYGSSVQLSFTIKTNRFVQSYSNYSDSHCFIVLDPKSDEFKELHIVGQTTVSNDDGYDPYMELTLTGNTSLSNLERGAHAVEVQYGFYYAWPNASYKIDFIVLSSAFVQFTVNGEINSESASPNLSPPPSPSPSLSLTPTPSPSPAPSSSPTQQPTLEPAQSAKPTPSPSETELIPFVDPLDYTRLYISVSIVALTTITIVGLAVYFKKYRKKKTAN